MKDERPEFWLEAPPGDRMANLRVVAARGRSSVPEEVTLMGLPSAVCQGVAPIAVTPDTFRREVTQEVVPLCIYV